MPADVSHLYGVSPPLFHQSYYSTFGAMNASDAFWRSSYNVFSTQRLHSSPRLHRKVTKTELKPNSKLSSPIHLAVPIYSQFDLSSILSNNAQPTPIIKSANSPSRPDKRVTFADSHGKSLTAVKYVTEPTSEPPKFITACGDLAQAISKLTLDSAEKTPERQPSFVVGFKQPVSDYVRFKEKLNEQNVCLENVVLKENKTIFGTVKVKNIAFSKSVSVRLTCDKWKTFEDYDCSFVKDAYSTSTNDTFQFNVSLDVPPSKKDIYVEFCIRFVCDNQEFWDSNCGKNYSVQFGNCTNVLSTANNSMSLRTGVPSTYSELPGPQFNSWQDWEGAGPFY